MGYSDMNMWERGQYMKKHLAEIVEDLRTLDDNAVTEKWGIGETSCHVLRKKHCPETIRRYKQRATKALKESLAAVKTERKEGVNMAAANEPVPLKPHDRMEWPAYWEENKEAVISDYHSMRINEFLLRWHMATITWKRLREGWKLKPKRFRMSPTVTPEPEKVKHTPTVREEHEKVAKGVLGSEDKIEITVGRLEEILRELEYLKGYRQAVLDIFGHKPQNEN